MQSTLRKELGYLQFLSDPGIKALNKIHHSPENGSATEKSIASLLDPEFPVTAKPFLFLEARYLLNILMENSYFLFTETEHNKLKKFNSLDSEGKEISAFRQVLNKIWEIAVAAPTAEGFSTAKAESSFIEYGYAGLNAFFSLFTRALPAYLQLIPRLLNAPFDWLHYRLGEMAEKGGKPMWVMARLLQLIIFLPKQALHRLANVMGYLSNLMDGALKLSMGILRFPIKILELSIRPGNAINNLKKIWQDFKNDFINGVWSLLKNLFRLLPEAGLLLTYFFAPPVAFVAEPLAQVAHTLGSVAHGLHISTQAVELTCLMTTPAFASQGYSIAADNLSQKLEEKYKTQGLYSIRAGVAPTPNIFYSQTQGQSYSHSYPLDDEKQPPIANNEGYKSLIKKQSCIGSDDMSKPLLSHKNPSAEYTKGSRKNSFFSYRSTAEQDSVQQDSGDDPIAEAQKLKALGDKVREEYYATTNREQKTALILKSMEIKEKYDRAVEEGYKFLTNLDDPPAIKQNI